jgi:hypothetical protein
MGIVREEDIQFWCTSKILWKSGVEMEERQQGECRKLIQTVLRKKCLPYFIFIAAYCIYCVCLLVVTVNYISCSCGYPFRVPFVILLNEYGLDQQFSQIRFALAG